MVTQIPDHLAADLETLFDHNAQTLNGSAGGLCNGNQTLQGTAIGKKIINNQNVIIGIQEFFGYDNLVFVLMVRNISR